MKHIIHKMYHPGNEKLGLLVLRVTLGAIFLVHGIQKLSNMEGTIGFFTMIGFSAFWAWLVAIVETAGGVAMILGISTRFVASLFAIISLVAITVVKTGKGFGAMELDLALLGLALGIGLLGCGKWSLCCMCHKGTCSMDEEHCGCNCPEKK